MRRCRLVLCPALLCFLAHAPSAAAAPPVRFEIESDFGAEGAWTGEYLELAARMLIKLMDNSAVAPPETIEVKLTKDGNATGIAGFAGFAGPDQLGFSSSVWPKEKYREWILAHELANLFAHHYAGSSFPADWWKADRGAFTDAFAAYLLEADGRAETAAWVRSLGAANRLSGMYEALLEVHGPALLQRAFALLRRDGVDRAKIEPGKEPSALRSAYAAAYLSLGAGRNLAPILRGHGVGKAPPHQAEGVPFAPYELTDAAVERLMRRREAVFAPAGPEAPRAAFRAGR